jgi:hypothetical protein
MKRLCGWWLTPFAVSLRPHPAMFSTEQLGEKTIFAMHERTFPRAAGVSPPWCVIRTMCGKNGALFG